MGNQRIADGRCAQSHKAPRLGIAHRRRIGRTAQDLAHVLIDDDAAAKMPHIAPPTQQFQELLLKTRIEHRRRFAQNAVPGQNSMPAWAFTPERNGCFSIVISVTRSAASISASGALRPVTMTCFISGLAVSTSS